MIKEILDVNRAVSSKLPNGLSAPLQLGKAAEHLACASLILQGYNAFLAEAGLPYDILVEHEGRFIRIQVKSTCKMMRSRPKRNGMSYLCTYRFAVRRGRVPDRRMKLDNCDFLACVALDIKMVGFFPASIMTKADGYSKQAMELKSRTVQYPKGKAGPDASIVGRFIEDYTVFNPNQTK